MLSPLTERGEHRKTGQAGGHDGLCHEAQVLAALRHPGVVSLTRDPGSRPQELFLQRVPGGNLVGRRLTAEEVGGLGAAVATTLADLHDLGVVYNGCSPDHILLDSNGAPVLCGFADAQFGLPARDMAIGQRGDTTALIEVLSDLVGGDRSSLQRVLRRERRQRHPSARSLARQLAGINGARLPTPRSTSSPDSPILGAALDPSDPLAPLDPLGRLTPAARAPDDETRQLLVVSDPLASAPADSSFDQTAPVYSRVGRAAVGPEHKAPRRKPRWGLAAGTAAAALVAMGAAIVIRSPAPLPPVGCPALDAGCQAIPTPNGVLTTPAGRWSLGRSGDVVVLGRWLCGTTALPAVLEPRDGQVWVFDRWARTGSDVAARFVGQVRGATSMRVEPASNGCDRVEVLGPGSRRTTLDPL